MSADSRTARSDINVGDVCVCVSGKCLASRLILFLIKLEFSDIRERDTVSYAQFLSVSLVRGTTCAPYKLWVVWMDNKRSQIEGYTVDYEYIANISAKKYK